MLLKNEKLEVSTLLAECSFWTAGGEIWTTDLGVPLQHLYPPPFPFGGLQEDGYLMKYAVLEEALLRKLKQHVRAVYFNTTKCLLTIKELEGIV